ncbi:2614_t:CDS:2, partial [Cetraspora pellucida]
WGRAQQHISPENKVLAIILYSDATMLDHLEKISRHPVFISLGNIPTKFCNKPEAKALVGIIPTLQGTLEEQQTPQFRKMIRSTFTNIMEMGKCKDYSLHEETNSFWTHLNFNIYTATVPEWMHHLDLGLFSYMVKFTWDLLKFHGGISLVNKMDLRFGLILRYPGLKIFNVGLAELTLFTASEYKQMMKVMPFILEGLLEGKKRVTCAN